MKQILVLLSILMTTSFIITGCGDDKTESVPQSEIFIEEGWKEYIGGNYDLAIQKFED